MTDAVFVSGWAGPETLFPGLSARLDYVAPFVDGDEAAVIARVAASPARVLAGWSTGAHMLLRHAATLFPHAGKVVLFAPFARFGDSFPDRIIQSMRAAMDEAPEATVRAFWKNCGAPGEPGAPTWNPAWAAPLAAGLDYLRASAVAETPVPAANVTVVWGTRDRIVRRAALDRALALLPGATLRVHDGGHWPSPDLLAEHVI
ncbi:alpha/beta fold hydrolase [Solidesulfovibrio alcoholivorans]|uniref:alpha/beta fold hydrolase n=1 Tax=Solidesulfovibrio alcoholivorans TaxID=81406 RepID=UPI0004977320|nr:alpha/beta hydrolase [Solidesulfovibrio alcoholivorans]